MIESTLTLAELARVWGDYWPHERLQHTFSNTFITPGDTPVESGEVGHWVASADDRPTAMGDLLQGRRRLQIVKNVVKSSFHASKPRFDKEKNAEKRKQGYLRSLCESFRASNRSPEW